MFEITRRNTNRLDIVLSGKLNADDMKSALDELEEKSQDFEKACMLYDIVDFHVPSLGAIAVELSRLPSLFRLLKRFSKTAVLSDKTWLQKVSELEGALIPGLEIKAFSREQKDEAEAWLQR